MPAFMPVGTQASVKGLEIEQLRATGAEMVLGNTYHLALRPGEEVVAALGGLHRFMGWDGPILTDSGGFQLFSLAHLHQSDRARGRLPLAHRRPAGGPLARAGRRHPGALGQRRGDGAGPRRGAAQRRARSSATPPSGPSAGPRRCRDAAARPDQALFAIVQGGLDPELRIACARQLRELDFAGYAVGGLSVGEQPADMYRMLDVTVPELPADRPRYLMGVGRPEDLLEGIGRGIDLFDCVMPTRNGRNAMAFTDEGPLRLRNLQYERDERPLQRRAVPVRPAGAAAGISATCSWPGRCSGRSCCRSTT